MSTPKRTLPIDEESPRLDRENPYLRVLCVNVFVRDQDRSLRYFVDQLGFSVVLDYNYDRVGRWVAVAPPDGQSLIALIAPKSRSEDCKPTSRSKHTVPATDDGGGK